MHYINGLSYGLEGIQLPDNIPGLIDYIPQEDIDKMSSQDRGRFEQWINANPQFKQYGKQAIDFFLSWLASRNNGDGYSAPSTGGTGIPSSGYNPTINQNDPKSNTTRNILIGTGVLLLVLGGIAFDQKNKKR